MLTRLKTRWFDFAQSHMAADKIEAAWQQFVSGYGADYRAYHNFEHLSEMFRLFDRYRDLVAAPELVEMAIWFHDVVYVIGSQTNESDSAEAAQALLTAAGWAEDRIASVYQLIIDTQHLQPSATADGQLLVDIDLAILGADPDRYGRYEQEIRAEYAAVPWDAYCQGRGAILSRFLDRPRIYEIEQIRQALEPQARTNLQAAIARLTSGMATDPID